MSDKDLLKALIIGAGTKGALYPDERLTHAHAFSGFGFDLIGFVDSDPLNLQKASERWGKPSFQSIEEAFVQKPDVVTVAVSDTAHFEVLKAIAEQEHKPRLVFTEKPFCQNYAQATEIAELYQEQGIEISVNFSRRFLPEFQDLECFSFKRFVGTFTKGIHNLSHLVDLATLLDVEIIQTVQIDRSDLNVFEVDLYGYMGKISILDHGAQIRHIPSKPRPDYSEDTVLDYDKEQITRVALPKAMGFAARNIYKHLKEGKPLLSTIENALHVMEVCDRWQP